MMNQEGWCRRAQPWLGTLVEVGVRMAHPQAALDAVWRVMADVQACMSAHDAASDLGRSHAALPGTAVTVHPLTAKVLQAAEALHAQTQGVLDVTQGSGRWCLRPSLELLRLDATTRFDLGGIAKGFAVDCAVEAALAAGAQAVWVNAGGDLRVQGCRLPVVLRDEHHGGVRPWLMLEDGAVATSDFSPGVRARLHTLRPDRAAAHVSVAAPQCMLADALTKLVAAVGDVSDPWVQEVLASHGAQAWLHGDCAGASIN